MEIVRGIRARLPRASWSGCVSPRAMPISRASNWPISWRWRACWRTRGSTTCTSPWGQIQGGGGDPDGGALLEAVRVGLAGRVPLMVAGKISDADSAEWPGRRRRSGGGGHGGPGNPDWMERVSRGLPCMQPFHGGAPHGGWLHPKRPRLPGRHGVLARAMRPEGFHERYALGRLLS